jgi:hypothetical protein
MIALPKATSQGSNGAGGGAFTGIAARSAASAELETIASAVANKTNFFMTFPIKLSKDKPDSPGPLGQAIIGRNRVA